MSMLETGTILNPLSNAVWRSVLEHCWAWMVIYFSTGAVLVASVVVTGVAYGVSTPLCSIVAGPVTVTTIWVCFRLLGGLAWYCAGAVIPKHTPPEKPKKRPAEEPRFSTPTSAGPPSAIPPEPLPPRAPMPEAAPPPPPTPKKLEEVKKKRPPTEGGSLEFDQW